MTKRSVSRLVSKSGMRRLIAGSGGKKSVLSQVLIYVLLTGVSFTFLYPILCFLSASGMDAYDLVDPLVNWLPRSFNTDNFVKAYNALGGYQTALSSLFWMGIVAVVQTVVSAMVAYGFAKHDFPFRRILFALMIATFFIPKQVSFLPEYVMFTTYKMDNSILPVLLPTIFGQGLRHAIFILIYVQFFRMAPPSLDEAASIDGANRRDMLLHITIPRILPSVAVMFLLSISQLFLSNFDQVYNLYNNFVLNTGDVLSTYIYRISLGGGGEFELSTAANLLLNVMGLIALVVTNRFVKKLDVMGIF